MALITLYGIKNCDTMKKAMQWLDKNGIEYSFHNYKKQGVDQAALEAAIAQHGWDTVINKRGTTWRQLPENVKSSMNAEKAVTAAIENPSLIKRPLLMIGAQTYIGFNEAQYKDILG